MQVNNPPNENEIITADDAETPAEFEIELDSDDGDWIKNGKPDIDTNGEEIIPLAKQQQT